MITYSDEKNIAPHLLLPLFEQADWSAGRTLEDTTSMISHTDLLVSAWEHSRLIGFGRVLTDYVFRASIWDVIIAKDYQGQDIGTQIMQNILQHPSLKQVELFWLCTRDKQAFYATLGFTDKEQTGMVWVRRKYP